MPSPVMETLYELTVPLWATPLAQKRRPVLGERRENSIDAHNIDEPKEKRIARENYRLIKISSSSNLTVGWLLDNVSRVVDSENVISVDCDIMSIDGFVSQIVKLSMNSRDEQKFKMIVKLPETKAIKAALEKTTGSRLADGADDKFVGSLNVFYNREISFYTMNNIAELRVPQIYFSRKWDVHGNMGCIAMEDLSHLTTVPFYESLNLAQIQSVSSQLLALHTYSCDMPSEWEKTFPYPMQLIDTVSNMTSIVKLFVERNPSLTANFQKLIPLYNNRQFFIRILRDSHREIGLPEVICHGDLWFYNMMWKVTGVDCNNNNVGKSSTARQASNEIGALIDWQNVHTGSIGEDLGHMLAFCCDSEVRRQVEREYLPKYFESLKKTIESKGKQFEISLDQFLRAYNRQFIAHALHLPFIACVMLSIKEASEDERLRRTEILVKRTQTCWEDALVRLQDEFPEYLM